MFPWCDPQASESQAEPAYAVGDIVYSGDCHGVVVAVDAEKATMAVMWEDGDSPITYPMDASYLRKALPWE